MFGNHRFENPYDPEDDGRDLEITPEEEAASDDQGRAEAEAFLSQMGTKERNQNDRNFRRWLLRSAKQALAEGAGRRRVARKKEKARVEAEAEAARVQVENARKAEKSKREFSRYCRESDAIWAGVWEQAQRDDAAWEAGRPEREASDRAAKAKMGASKSMTSTTPNRAAGPARSPARPVPPAPRPTRRTAPPPQQVTAGPSAGSHAGTPTARVPAPKTATPPTTLSAPKVQARRESPISRLNPPPTLPAFAPPLAPAAPRPAPPSARPIPAAAPPPTRSVPRPSPSSETRPSTPTRSAISSPAASRPLPPPPPPAAPAPPEPPPFAGADLAAYRASLGLSQGVLAERLGTTQGTVSKAEGNPSALLGPTLRRAMWDAQRGAGAPSR